MRRLTALTTRTPDSIVPRSIRALQMCKICIARHQNDDLGPLLDGKLDRIAGG
jgi:hypothetical protein